MYELKFEGKKWAILVKDGGGFRGSLEEVTNYCIHYLGFVAKDIDIALDDMIRSKHNSASFGVLGGYIYTFDGSKQDTLKEIGFVHELH
jgi:hypothetical protein